MDRPPQGVGQNVSVISAHTYMIKIQKILAHLQQLAHPIDFLRLVSKNLLLLRWQIYLRSKGVVTGHNVIVKGKPVILRRTGAILLGNNVTLRSDDYGYHASIYAPTRLMTDTKKDAVIEIGDNTRINGASIHATERIAIGKNCLIASNVTIIDSDGHGIYPSERGSSNPVSLPVIIDDNVWIGINSIILKGVRIGTNAVIGAGSVVTKSIPSNSVAAGNPARVVRTFDDRRNGRDINLP